MRLNIINANVCMRMRARKCCVGLVKSVSALDSQGRFHACIDYGRLRFALGAASALAVANVVTTRVLTSPSNDVTAHSD